MKKLIAILLTAAMLFCVAGCQTPETPETPDNSKEPVQDSYTYTYRGTQIALHAPAADIIAALGEPDEYTEETSCAFDGLDKIYRYGSIYLQTYPIGQKDYIYGWWFVDDLVETEECIAIGSPKSDVEAMYGEENYNGTNAYTVKKGSGVLTIILENDVVTSVQYVIVTE